VDMNGPLAAEVVGAFLAAAAVIYAVGVLLLVDHNLNRLRNFERSSEWKKGAALWPWYAAGGAAALALEATRSAGRRRVVEGER